MMNGNTLEDAIKSAKKLKKNKVRLNKKSAYAEGLQLVESSKICLLGTNAEGGFPNIKAMLNLKHEGLEKVWFSTNTSSRRVQQIMKDGRSCVYYVDEANF